MFAQLLDIISCVISFFSLMAKVVFIDSRPRMKNFKIELMFLLFTLNGVKLGKLWLVYICEALRLMGCRAFSDTKAAKIRSITLVVHIDGSPNNIINFFSGKNFVLLHFCSWSTYKLYFVNSQMSSWEIIIS